MQFGIDLGGTKTEIIVLDDAGQVRFKQRVATPSDSYEAILQTIVALVRQAESTLSAVSAPSTKATCLGVGAPGTPFGSEGRLKNANTTCLIGQPLATDLQALLQIPVVVENDANCLVLSEAVDGAAARGTVVFGVILGTGVGGGLAINQQLINGPNRITGEWGHNPLPHWFKQQDHSHPKANKDNTVNTAATATTRPCYCGLTDCIETYLSGKGLCQTYRELRSGTAAQRTAALTDASAIAAAALQADPAAQSALNQYYNALSQSLATVINVIDPDVIVFGGGLSQLPGLCDAVHDRLSQHVFGGDMQTELVIAKHGDASGVRGAAWLTRHIVETCPTTNSHHKPPPAT